MTKGLCRDVTTLRIFIWGDYLGSSRWAHCNNKGPYKWRREEALSQLRRWDVGGRGWSDAWWRERWGPWAKKCRSPPEAGKSKETDSPLDLPKGTQPDRPLPLPFFCLRKMLPFIDIWRGEEIIYAKEEESTERWSWPIAKSLQTPFRLLTSRTRQ